MSSIALPHSSFTFFAAPTQLPSLHSRASSPSPSSASASSISGIEVLGPLLPRFDEILTPAALHFVAALHRRFNARRVSLLHERVTQQQRWDAGEAPTFPAENHACHSPAWRGAPLTRDLTDRRVEITGPPVPSKMVINALNSGARVFMADFEDSLAPTWNHVIQGQLNLKDANARSIDFKDPVTGKLYALNKTVDPSSSSASSTSLPAGLATLMVRPRGWHLEEAHLRIDGQRVSASLFDFALYYFHNVALLLLERRTPAFYLPKLESSLEAQLWASVFEFSEAFLNHKLPQPPLKSAAARSSSPAVMTVIPKHSIRATVLIETLPGAFALEAILYELRDYSAGCNSGRWDYLLSVLKKRRHDPRAIMPDRQIVGMKASFMAAYVRHLIAVCHARGVHVIGGMAAQIPSSNAEANARAFSSVKADKEREVALGCDGTWVAHPALIPVAAAAFARVAPHQIASAAPASNAKVTASDLLDMSSLPRVISFAGVLTNIEVCVTYISAYLKGVGCVPIHNLMEDAATAEISRTQLWQWARHHCKITAAPSDSSAASSSSASEQQTHEGELITVSFLAHLMDDLAANMRSKMGVKAWNEGRWPLAFSLLQCMTAASTLDEFLTLPAYEFIIEDTAKYYSVPARAGRATSSAHHSAMEQRSRL